MALVDNNAPLRLADGTLVYPDNRIIRPDEEDTQDEQAMVEIPTNAEAQRMVTQVRRKVADLPDVPKTTNVVAVVLSYTLFGLSDEDIAITTNLTVSQVENIKQLRAYSEIYDAVVQGIRETEATSVREVFSQHALKSANVIVNRLSSRDPTQQLVAAREVLDRAGFRPADIVEHRHSMEGGLTIEIIRKDNTVTPTIDLTLENE